MKVAILGATGKTGAHAVNDALAAGHEVVAYVRHPHAVTPRNGLTIVNGSVEDENALRSAFAGAGAVVSCLGARVSISALAGRVDFQQRVLPKILAAVDAASVGRFVLMSSFGIGSTRSLASRFARVLYRTFARGIFDDKALAERALSGCRANWTAVYPVSLRKGRAAAAWDLVPLDQVRLVPGMPSLTFATVAKVLIDLLSDETHARQKLLLTTRGGWR